MLSQAPLDDFVFNFRVKDFNMFFFSEGLNEFVCIFSKKITNEYILIYVQILKTNINSIVSNAQTSCINK